MRLFPAAFVLAACTLLAATAAHGHSATSAKAARTGAASYYDHWQSPTGRIRCDYRDQVGVGCVQLDRGWGMFLHSFAGATYGYPFAIPGPGRTLYYGQTWRASTFRCLSQSIGMKCWSTLTRHGFFISRETRYRS
jgi:hypothetical protein